MNKSGKILRCLRLVLLLSIGVLGLEACSTTRVKDQTTIGTPPLCRTKTHSLGQVALLPETQFREDQKEPEKRIAMAQNAIRSVFSKLPCGRVEEGKGIHKFSNWSTQNEQEILNQLETRKIDTAIFFRIKEMTPHLILSIPVLWSTTRELDFDLRVVDVQTGKVHLEIQRNWNRGGPFVLKGAQALENDLEIALQNLITASEN